MVSDQKLKKGWKIKEKIEKRLLISLKDKKLFQKRLLISLKIKKILVGPRVLPPYDPRYKPTVGCHGGGLFLMSEVPLY